MYSNDNTIIRFSKTLSNEDLRKYKDWLKERNIKFSVVREPLWSAQATGLNMRNQDALMFKMVFGL